MVRGLLGVRGWRERDIREGFTNGDEGGRKVRWGGELKLGRGGGGISKNCGGEGDY